MTGSTRIFRPVNAREAAFAALENTSSESNWASDRVHAICDESRLSPADRGFSYELTAGVIRRQRTLDAVISSVVAKPLDQLEPGLVTLICLGTYQLLFLDGVASYAAVNETVAIAARAGKPRWTSFANGVLRSISRLLTGEVSSQPSPFGVPLDSARYRQLLQPIFPDPERQASRYFAEAFSFPDELATGWAKRFSAAALFRMGSALNGISTPCLRVNALRPTGATLIDRLTEQGFQLEPSGVEQGWRVVKEPTPLAKTLEFQQGEFTIQDETAIQAAILVDPQAGETVWDVCAAPGTKTTHLAELMGDSGTIIATDLSRNRIERIVENIHRLGLESISALQISATGSDAPTGPFDRILLDVPCSNTGVLGKRPEARWRFQQSALNELTTTQLFLAELAIERLKPGGVLVYSTCSIEPEENSEVVAAICRRHSEMSLQAEHLALPGEPADGGYQALLVKAFM